MEKMNCSLIQNCSLRPAQAVLDKIARAMAQRRDDETKEELEQVLKRIEMINANYELSQSMTYRATPDTFECFADLKELEELLRDQFKRKKFQDKVTVFVVGCHTSIAENVTILQQINDFFASSSTNFDDDFKSFETDDFDIGSMSSAVHETLETTEVLINRLGEINYDLVQCLTQLEQKKTSKGRKKLEMTLQQTKDDAVKLSETLLRLQQDMLKKEERIHLLSMQLELKNKEILRLNSSAVSEATKRNSVEVESLKSVISNRDRQISQLEGDVRRLEKELAKFTAQFDQCLPSSIEPQVEFVPSLKSSSTGFLQQLHQDLPHDDSNTRTSYESAECNENAEISASCETTKIPAYNGPQIVMNGFTSPGSSEVQETGYQNGATEIVIQKESKEDVVSRYHPFVKDAAKLTVGAQIAPSLGPTAKSNDGRTNNKGRHISKVLRKTSNGKQEFGPSHSTSGRSSGSSLSVPGIGLSDARKSLSALPEEEIQQFNESLDLKDEEAWSGYSSEEIPLRFKQFRTLALNRISELEDELEVTIRKTCNKVDSLKQQFQDQRHKWETKQRTLVDDLREMHVLQREAEQDIGLALTHLEDVVNMNNNQVKEDNQVLRDDLWPMMEVISQSQLTEDADNSSEISLKEEVTGFVERDRLETMTDDAKAQMSRESTKIFSDAAKDLLVAELSITDEQQPTEGEQILYSVKPTTTIVSEMVDNSTSPLDFTWSKVDIDECHERCLGIRQRMEERLMKTNLFVVSSDFASSSPHDALDVDNEGQVLEGQPRVMRSQGTSPAEFINELSTDTLQPTHIVSPVTTVLEDYLKTYDDILIFQQNLANYLPINASSVDRVIFDRTGPLKSQVALLSHSINRILCEVMNCVATLPNSIKLNNSSNTINQTNNQQFVNNKNLEADEHLDMEKVAFPAENKEETELQAEYKRLSKALEQEKKLHRDQFHHNSTLVSEMQDTIGNLKRELSSLRVKANGITQHHLQPLPSPFVSHDPVIFTRLDSERNVKIMQKAIVEQRISVDRCKAVLRRMKRYVDLPGQRLQHLAHTYVQHKNLLEIQENLCSGDGIGSEFLGLLSKMESYQKKRLEKCDEKSRALSQERARLAKELVEILSNIELESGIFLIKPVYSYTGSNNNTEPSSQHKRTRLNQPNQAVKRQLQPHTSPVSMTTDGPENPPSRIIYPAGTLVKSSDHQLENGLQGTAKQLIGEPTRPLWKQSESTANQMIDSRSQPSIPHLLELDVNRVMIGNNNISVKLHPNSSSTLSTSSCTRSYVAASRPNGSVIPHRSASAAGLNSVPPSTPILHGAKTEPEGGKLFNLSSQMSPTPAGSSLVATPPLPPIPPSKTNDIDRNVMTPAGTSITQYADEQNSADSMH